MNRLASLNRRLRRRTFLHVLTGVIAPTAVANAAATCLPSGVAAPVRPAALESVAPTRISAATVFVDVSGSMAGYVAPPRPATPARSPRSTPVQSGVAEPRAFRDLILSMPTLLGAVADHVSAFTFGRSIRPLPLADFSRAARPDFYREAESRIGEALARLETLPGDELGLVLTDLFLTDEEIFGGASAIRAPLGRMLESGRSIGLMGVRSGFTGTIFDIPVVRNYDGATERPFYLIIVGSAAAVARLIRRVEAEIIAPLPPTSDGEARSHATIFAREPLVPGMVPIAISAERPASIAAGLIADLPPEVQQVSFSGSAGSVTGTLSLSDRVQGPVLVPDQFRIQEAVWAEAPGARSRACGERWVAIQSLSLPLTTVVTRGGSPALSIGGAALSRIPPGVPFLLRAEVKTVGLSDAPAATAWARAWNLEAREAEAFVTSRPQLFRTLHLREIVAMLEALVRENLSPTQVTEAVIAFEVTRR